jgi:hypothetical protein
MNIDIRAATVENPELQGLQGKFKLLAGKMAGICYMPDDYLSLRLVDGLHHHRLVQNVVI